MDLKAIQALIDLFDQSDLSHLEVQNQTEHYVLDKALAQPVQTTKAQTPEKPQATPAPADEPTVNAPFVGTFYTSESPEKPPFVQVGDKVAAGQTVGIIEAMKMMNEVKADKAGIVREILAANASSVEYGQPLIRLGD